MNYQCGGCDGSFNTEHEELTWSDGTGGLPLCTKCAPIQDELAEKLAKVKAYHAASYAQILSALTPTEAKGLHPNVQMLYDKYVVKSTKN